MAKNNIGIEIKKADQLIQKLNELLANTQVFYVNVRGLHWNIQGDKFFELHMKFEELYNDLNLKVDEIAERILTLGGQPFHAYSQYLKEASIKELKDIKSATPAVSAIVKSLGILIELERKLLALANQAGDEGTSTLISDYISMQEKQSWMYSAYLKK
jgi:starvation-inducible DNA-binding protein